MAGIQGCIKRVFLFVVVLCSLGISLYAQHRHTSLSWYHVTGGDIKAIPLIGKDNRVHVISDDWYLYTFSADGHLEWRLQLPEKPANGFCCSSTGILYIGLVDGQLIAVNSKGSILWNVRKERGTPLYPTIIENSLIYHTLEKGILYAISHNGNLLWSFSLDAHIVISPILDENGNLYVVDERNRLYAFSSWGEIKWTRQFDSLITSIACGPLNNIYIGDRIGNIISLDKQGMERWRLHRMKNESIATILTDMDGTVMGVGIRGTIVSISESGELEWHITQETPLSISGAVLLEDRSLYLASNDGKLYYITKTGDTKRLYQFESAITLPNVVLENRLYIGSNDWVLYALTSHGKQQGYWTCFRGNTYFSGHAGVVSNLYSGNNHWERDIYFQWLKELARSPKKEDRRKMIFLIEKSIDEAELRGSLEYVRSILQFIVAEPYVTDKKWRNRSFNKDIRYRKKALQLLTKIGDIRTRNFLLDLLHLESNVEMKISIIQNLGKLCLDPDGRTGRALISMYRKERESETKAILAKNIMETLKQIKTYYGE